MNSMKALQQKSKESKGKNLSQASVFRVTNAHRCLQDSYNGQNIMGNMFRRLLTSAFLQDWKGNMQHKVFKIYPFLMISLEQFVSYKISMFSLNSFAVVRCHTKNPLCPMTSLIC